MATSCLEHRSQSFAWNAASFGRAADYSLTLTDDERGELVAAVRAMPDPKSVQTAAAAKFAMPTRVVTGRDV